MGRLDNNGVARLWQNILNLLSGYVTKVDGKALSTNDFTNEHKSKLEGLTEFSGSWNDLTDKPFGSDEIAAGGLWDGNDANYTTVIERYGTNPAGDFEVVQWIKITDNIA